MFGNRSGQLTIFLSLVLTLITSFILSMAQFAQIQSARGAASAASQMALDSVFAEYQKDLLEEYRVLFLDSGYGKGNASLEKVLERFESYLNYEGNLSVGLYSHSNKVNWGYSLQNVQIDAIEYASDHNGAPLRRQISEYMQEKTGISIIESLTGTEEALERDALELKKQEEEFIKEQEELEKELGSSEEDMSGDEILRNSEELKSLHSLESRGILNLVLSDPTVISTKRVPIDDTVSHRSRQSGFGVIRWEQKRNETMDVMLFRKYVQENSGCYGRPAGRERVLEYEKEYLIAGRESDHENLKKTAEKLLLMREGVNFTYLLTDAGKQAEAGVLAAAICSLVALPVFTEPVKWGILLGWSFLESVIEVRTLLAGGKISMIKNAGNWKTAITHLQNAAETIDGIGVSSDPQGLTYAEWLDILLNLQSTENLTYRFMDLMEGTIREISCNPGFRMDQCVAGLSVVSDFCLPRNTYYTTRIYYGYQ